MYTIKPSFGSSEPLVTAKFEVHVHTTVIGLLKWIWLRLQHAEGMQCLM
jgi:hypothetical protein